MRFFRDARVIRDLRGAQRLLNDAREYYQLTIYNRTDFDRIDLHPAENGKVYGIHDMIPDAVEAVREFYASGGAPNAGDWPVYVTITIPDPNDPNRLPRYRYPVYPWDLDPPVIVKLWRELVRLLA